MIQELRGRGLCKELALVALDEAGLARLLHRRTEGNPLFLTNVVDHWLPRGLLEKSLEVLSLDLPDTVRGLLDRQLAMLSPGEQAILHREVLYDRLPPRRKSRLHARIGAERSPRSGRSSSGSAGHPWQHARKRRPRNP